MSVLAALALASAIQGLEERLNAEGAAALAEAARRDGDPRRGAAVFHLPQLGCTRCHAAGDEGLGPDLSRIEKELPDAHLVEAILEPSRNIRKGFVAVTLRADDVEISGLLVEETDQQVVVRDLSPGGG